jgi:predicted DNA-binding ribbon-helix-helix protein
MKSPVVKRSIVVAGHKTSVSLEDAFWEGLKDIAKARRVTLSDLVSGIDTNREYGNLSSAIRLWDYQEFRARGRFSSLADEPFAEDDGELGLGLEPFARRPFPFVSRVVQNQV